jgi:hypothetical protein
MNGLAINVPVALAVPECRDLPLPDIAGSDTAASARRSPLGQHRAGTKRRAKCVQYAPKSAFTKHSVCDRHAFALRNFESGTAACGSREKLPKRRTPTVDRCIVQEALGLLIPPQQTRKCLSAQKDRGHGGFDSPIRIPVPEFDGVFPAVILKEKTMNRDRSWIAVCCFTLVLSVALGLAEEIKLVRNCGSPDRYNKPVSQNQSFRQDKR